MRIKSDHQHLTGRGAALTKLGSDCFGSPEHQITLGGSSDRHLPDSLMEEGGGQQEEEEQEQEWEGRGKKRSSIIRGFCY